MPDSRKISELFARFMEESGQTKRWVMVNELRKFYGIDKRSSPAISGFLKWIYTDPFPFCGYRVDRIEKITILMPYPRIIRRYLVRKIIPGRSDSGICNPLYITGNAGDTQETAAGRSS